MLETTEDTQELVVEVEEINVSDTEAPAPTAEPVNIDYNCRITSRRGSFAMGSTDGRFCESENNYSAFQSETRDLFGDANYEEMEFSDEDEPCSALQKINLDGFASVSVKRHADTASSYNYSSTVFKEDGCITDSELLSDDESNTNISRHPMSKHNQNLSSGVSLASGVKDGISLNGTPLASLHIANSYSDSILIKKKPLLNSSDIMKTPLMTCLEFLKANHSDDEATDVEDLPVDSDDAEFDEKPVYNLMDLPRNHSSGSGGNFLDDVLRCRKNPQNDRKPSWTTELLVDDGIENDVVTSKKRSNRKKLSNADEYANECSTDEEEFNLLGNKEWTETDESGGVRQITQIKTETSIKLEGDGDGSAFDSDGLVSTTATTTTRVVTSVITHPDDQSDNEQHASEDDVRQSCEITFSEVVNDSAPKSDESGHEE